MTTISADDFKIVGRAPLFAGLPKDALETLLRSSRVVEIPRGKVLFVRGEPAERFYLVLNGWVKVYRDNPNGEQAVIAIIKPGETIAEAAIFMARDYPASAEAVNESRLLEIPGRPFVANLRSDSDLALGMLTAMSMRLRRMVKHIEQLQANSTPQRLGNFLLSLSDDGSDTQVVRLPYDKTLVAARLGMKPESLSRALAKLKTIGVVTKGNKVELTDIERLRNYCHDRSDF
ncbi:MAG: Crp/Fnr family transcriptional regulator [Alphaproteobacteria bacterium]|jgi:CRP-like cAMP-binding protein|nr:Crp/Fnr family transcriptional regulator [Rhodospirillales bacterium]MDP6952730.1 Crp/Fnr family transcriptional regulator [Alphaproteobacteria bacterium]